MGKTLAAIALLTGMVSLPSALAQTAPSLERVVVTASRVDTSSTGLPAISLVRPADFILAEITFVNGSRDTVTKSAQLKRSVNGFLSAIKAADGLSAEVEFDGGFAPADTAEFEEFATGLETEQGFARATLRIRIIPGEGLGFRGNVGRVKAIASDLKNVGRTEWFVGDEQEIGVFNPQGYRRELLTAIADDVANLRELFPETTFRMHGLHEPVRIAASGPMEVTLYIPYTMDHVIPDANEIRVSPDVLDY